MVENEGSNLKAEIKGSPEGTPPKVFLWNFGGIPYAILSKFQISKIKPVCRQVEFSNKL